MQLKLDSVDQCLKTIDIDWKKREEALNSLLKQLSFPNSQIQVLAIVSEIPKHLAIQFSDLRSGIVKLASEVVCQASELAKKNPNINFHKFTDIFLRETSFYKALGNGNKIIVRHASTALLSLILNDCVSADSIEIMFNMQKNNKIIPIRENVSEAILTFVQNILKPEKSNGTTMFSTSEMSTKIPGDISAFDSVKKDENVDMDFLQQQKRMKSANSKVSKIPSIQISDLKKTQMSSQKLKLENIKFFTNAAEFFIKDATQSVRNFGKQIKSETDKLTELLSRVGETKNQIFSEIIDENDPSLNKEIEKPKRIKEKLFSPTPDIVKIPRDSFPAKIRQDLEIVKKQETAQIKQIFEQKPIGERIQQVLRDESMNPRDKSETVELIISKEKGLLQISLQQYVDILSVYENIKNSYLRDSLVKILTASEIESFKFVLLDYLVEKRITRKLTFNAVNNFVLNKIGPSAMIDVFLSKTGEDYVGLLKRISCDFDFDSYFESKKGTCEKLINKIVQNVSFLRRKFDDQQTFEAENLFLFEKTVNTKIGNELIFKMSLDKNFLSKLNAENPQFYKFLTGNSKKNSDETKTQKVSGKSSDQDFEIPSQVKLEEVFKKSTPEIRFELLKSLLPHINKLTNPSVGENTKAKIIAKTIDIVKFSFDFSNSDETGTFKIGLQIISVLFDVGVCSADSLKLSQFMFELFRKKDLLYNEEVVPQFLHILSVNSVIFRNCVTLAEKSTDKPDLVFFTQLWSRIMFVSRTNSQYSYVQKSMHVHMKEMIEVVKKKLIQNTDTLTRKTGVLFMVQAYFLTEKKLFERYITDLTVEQRALIMVYVQKESKQNF